MSRLARDRTAEPVSRDQILRHERGQGNIHFSCSVDHVQDWHPYSVHPYPCYMCVTIQTVFDAASLIRAIIIIPKRYTYIFRVHIHIMIMFKEKSDRI